MARSAWPILSQAHCLRTAGNKSAEVCNIVQRTDPGGGKIQPMSLGSFYLHKVDQCARLADDAAEPCERARLVSERQAWLRILAGEIGTDATRLEAALVGWPKTQRVL